MWYKIQNDKIVGIAPKNKKLNNGNLIINYNLNRALLLADGYVEYTGNKSIDQLNIIDGKIVQKSDEEIIIEEVIAKDENWHNYYQKNPDLATCVRQYKDILDSYNLSYKSKSYDIYNVIVNDESKSDIEKTKLAFLTQSLWNNIILNIEQLNIRKPMSFAWENIQKLIEYLPGE